MSGIIRACDEDSGRSSCSGTSGGLSPVIDNIQHAIIRKKSSKTQEASTNTDLKVSVRPRSCVFKSPGDKDPFPSCRLSRNRKIANIFHLLDTPRMGGLSNAHSTLDIISSTQIEQPKIENNAVSLAAIHSIDKNDDRYKFCANFRHRRPVQRAASRLYKAEASFKGKDCCVGPEFIVRASQSAKTIDLTVPGVSDKRVITVVLLNGLRIEVICNPNVVTASNLFESTVQSEKYDHNFMLGIAVLIGGDFIFLPDEYKIKKIAPDGWCKTVKGKKSFEDISLTVFLRIKFFLPTNIARNIQAGEWRYRVYLQLRRATVEGQLTSTIQNLILLSGYALHIEFGEFSYREHGSADYFLLEHYLPESVITNDMADIKLRMKKAHESRCGMERNKAIVNFVTLAQTFRDYGAHFYSAVWATRDGFCRDVWLSIGPRGITIYSRTNHSLDELGNSSNRIVLQSLPWHHIHTFYYNKKSLYILPNSNSGLSKIGVKYKLKMTDGKSYFTFWLASLHHRLYMKLYTKDDFINYLSDELSCPLNDSPSKSECSNYQDSYNLAVRNPNRIRKPVRRRFRVDGFNAEKLQNKENNKPNTEELQRKILTPQNKDCVENVETNCTGNSSNDGLSSSEGCSLPRRQGVKMGTRVFNNKVLNNKYPQSSVYHSNQCFKSDGDLATTQSDSDDLSSDKKQHFYVNSMKLLPERQYTQDLCHAATAYVLESPKVYKDAFNLNTTSNESCINTSLFEKLDNMGCVQGERVFVTAVLERSKTKSLGLQVAEGSDGNVYIKSITCGGPADLCKKLLPGDQIISVNGQTLINVKYELALSMLQSAPHTVELIVLQNAKTNSILDCPCDNATNYCSTPSLVNHKSVTRSITRPLDSELTDDELINEEALKTIYALIKLTKDKVINRIKDRDSLQNSPNKNNLQQNRVYDESDAGNFSSQENTPEKANPKKFNSWRDQFTKNRPKRRPLSLSIPSDVNLPNNYLDSQDTLLKKSSLKSIQSSLNSLDNSPKSMSSKNVALPRNYGLSRRWVGPVRYPVTPCKNNNEESAMRDDNVKRKHFIYVAENSDEDQIFL